MMLCLVFGPDLIKIIAECNLIKSFSWSKVNGPGGPVVPVDFYCFFKLRFGTLSQGMKSRSVQLFC